MYKETIICIIIVIVIFIGNSITQNYTKTSVEETSNNLNELREEITKESINKEEVKKKINKIHEQWDKRHDKLAYYIEHDELEKVETHLILLQSNIEVGDYEQGIGELDSCGFVLEHIQDKESLNLKNIF